MFENLRTSALGETRPPSLDPGHPSPLACPGSQGPGVLGGPRGARPGKPWRAGGTGRGTPNLLIRIWYVPIPHRAIVSMEYQGIHDPE